MVKYKKPDELMKVVKELNSIIIKDVMIDININI